MYLVDGRAILIDPMDEAHLISRCTHQRTEDSPSGAFRQFHEEIVQRYGNTEIIALHEDKIVGFVNFCPAALNTELSIPLYSHIPEDKFEWSLDQMMWPENPGEILSISSINLD